VNIGIHWFRRDLRLADNTALHAAAAACDIIWPVFVFDPAILRAPDIGAARVAFLLECLASLEKTLAAAGGRLILRHGNPAEELPRLARETGAATVFWNRDYEPCARQCDVAVEKSLAAAGIAVETRKDSVLHEGHEVLKENGGSYAIFTPYSRVWRALPKPEVLPAVKFKPATGPVPRSEPLPTAAKLGFSPGITLPPAGERAARDLLKRFIAGPVTRYRSRRDFPGLDGTSRLSPHLCCGTLSPRTVYAAAIRARREHPSAAAEIDTFVSELVWREFYRQILWHHPHAATAAFKPECRNLRWENNEKYFAAWCEGRTGYPIVDAAMRQLNTTGWMHNRLRMITAMFLTKDLLVSWQWGEHYFMRKLLDGDLAANNGGWQWSASTGTDAAPYFRIFNPNSQAAKFDPEGKFIARHVPEAEMPGRYPAPIVRHAEQRVKALALFKKVQQS
jgi:deoxyribodipyrimidine photo-lyase